MVDDPRDLAARLTSLEQLVNWNADHSVSLAEYQTGISVGVMAVVAAILQVMRNAAPDHRQALMSEIADQATTILRQTTLDEGELSDTKIRAHAATCLSDFLGSFTNFDG